MERLSKRIYRGILLSLVVLVIAPMEDGCKMESAHAASLNAATVKESQHLHERK